MTDEQTTDRSAPGLLDTLLTPLRLPRRVAAEIETISDAVRALAGTAERRLRSIDDRAGELVTGLATLQASVKRLERKVDELNTLEETIEVRMEALREDLNTRMLAIQHQVLQIQPPVDQLARDVSKLDELLPDPGDGPLTRLKDTLSRS